MKKWAYYSEWDPFAAQWLRNLIKAGLLMDGIVDERSITDVHPDDVRGFIRVGFFAGIGGWERALQLADWPKDREIWHGSCPCQPFSVAGKGKGTDDARHLWPEFKRLIAECRPPVVFGEQVASAAGREWLAGVQTDLETLGFAVGAADLCAAGVGAPHIRQRLWWVADAIQPGLQGHTGYVDDRDESGRLDPQPMRSVTTTSGSGWGNNWIPCGDGKARRIEPGLAPLAHAVSVRVAAMRPNGQLHWYNRTGAIKGFGNAIVPGVAAEFIKAYMECRP